MSIEYEFQLIKLSFILVTKFVIKKLPFLDVIGLMPQLRSR